MGMRPYILWRRFILAWDLLAQGESISTAAHRAGFADAAHFTRTSNRMFGFPHRCCRSLPALRRRHHNDDAAAFALGLDAAMCLDDLGELIGAVNQRRVVPGRCERGQPLQVFHACHRRTCDYTMPARAPASGERRSSPKPLRTASRRPPATSAFATRA